MNLLRKILIARTSIQSAIGITFAFIALLVDGIDPRIALGIVGVLFAWMAVTSEVVFGQSLEELDALVETRSAEAVKLAKADVTSGLPPASEGAVDRGLLEQLLS